MSRSDRSRVNELAARCPVVAIDGPAGSGKTTIGRLLANSVGFLCLDSGLFYRAVALAATRGGSDLNSSADVLRGARALRLEFVPDLSGRYAARVVDCETDITDDLFSSDVEQAVSLVSRIAEVREVLLDAQREVLRGGNVVALGRDIGTVVCPEANLKIYLDATLETRVHRRWVERQGQGNQADISDVRDGIVARDRIDSERATAPMRVASDAVTISTDGVMPEEVVERIKGLMVERSLISAA